MGNKKNYYPLNIATNDATSERQHSEKTRTSGILQNNFGQTVQAHVEVANLNDESRDVRVQILNWGNQTTLSNPTLFLDSTQTIPANSRVTFQANVPSVFHYEVRIIDSHDHILVTTYARPGVGTGIFAGLTVLNSEFTKIELENNNNS